MKLLLTLVLKGDDVPDLGAGKGIVGWLEWDIPDKEIPQPGSSDYIYYRKALEEAGRGLMDDLLYIEVKEIE